MMDNAFDLRQFKAKNHIDDALGVRPKAQQPMPDPRMPYTGPVPNQRPTQIPGNPQLTPQGMAVSGQQQVGPGMVSGGAMVSPQGFGGGGANFSMPAAGGQFNVGASMDPRMKLAQMQAQYDRGPFSVGAQYQPGAGVSGSVGYRKAFAKGGLAMGGGSVSQPFNPQLPQELLDRAAQVEAINQRYKSQYGLQDKDIQAMFQGTYGLNMADPANSSEFEAARLISSPYRNELANIYGNLPTMRYALSSPVNALGQTRDSLSQLGVARDRAQQSLVDSSSPEWEQQYLAYMTGATEQMPPAPIGNTPEEWTRRMEIVRTYGPDTAQATVKNWGDTRSAYPDRVAAERAEANEVREGSVGAYNTALTNLTRGAEMARGGLVAKKMAKGGAWTRKEGQNPEGGLNAKGRASLRAQGKDIKPPVSAKQAKKSPKAAARRKSFCARMSGMPGPMEDDKGRPTRKALSLRKWDC